MDKFTRKTSFEQWFSPISSTKLEELVVKTRDLNQSLSKELGDGVLKFLGNKRIVNKVLGTLVYDRALSNYRDNSYQKYSFQKAISISEKGTLK